MGSAGRRQSVAAVLLALCCAVSCAGTIAIGETTAVQSEVVYAQLNHFNIATDGHGNFGLVYARGDTTTAPLNSLHMCFRQLSATQSTWSMEKELSVRAGQFCAGGGYPSIAADGADTWVVTWPAAGSFGSDFETSTEPQVAYVCSADRGSHWTEPRPLTTYSTSTNYEGAAPVEYCAAVGKWVTIIPRLYPGMLTSATVMAQMTSTNGNFWSAPVQLGESSTSINGVVNRAPSGGIAPLEYVSRLQKWSTGQLYAVFTLKTFVTTGYTFVDYLGKLDSSGSWQSLSLGDPVPAPNLSFSYHTNRATISRSDHRILKCGYVSDFTLGIFGGGSFQNYVNFSNDDGVTWTAANTLPAYNTFPFQLPCVIANGPAVVFGHYNRILSYSIVDAAGVQPPERVVSPDNSYAVSPLNGLSVAIDDSGRGILLWSTSLPGGTQLLWARFGAQTAAAEAEWRLYE